MMLLPAAGRRVSGSTSSNYGPPSPLSQGNVGLQTNYGPPNRTLDFSIFKNFPITERFAVQFRAEGTNIANTPQYSPPDSSLQDTNFGRITSTLAGHRTAYSVSVETAILEEAGLKPRAD